MGLTICSIRIQDIIEVNDWNQFDFVFYWAMSMCDTYLIRTTNHHRQMKLFKPDLVIFQCFFVANTIFYIETILSLHFIIFVVLWDFDRLLDTNEYDQWYYEHLYLVCGHNSDTNYIFKVARLWWTPHFVANSSFKGKLEGSNWSSFLWQDQKVYLNFVFGLFTSWAKLRSFFFFVF